jgi:membrane-associated phospholipid phosphatase
METLQAIDRHLFELIHVHFKQVILDVLCPILRDKRTWIPLYGFLLFSLYKKNTLRKAGYYLLFVVFLILASDLLCAKVLKELFHRLRPCQDTLLSGIAMPLVHCSETYSFPSCHAMNHFSLAFFFSVTLFRQWSAWLILWAASVGFSQVYVGVHYPMDIAAGAFFGWGLGKIFQLLYEKTIS